MTRDIAGWEVPGAPTQSIIRCRSLNAGRKDCSSSGHTARPTTTKAAATTSTARGAWMLRDSSLS